MTFNNLNKINGFIKLLIYNTTLTLLFLTISCERASTEDLNTISTDNKKPKIVVTTTHIRDLVQKITGNRFRIHSLMGPGVDPHIYKPTSRDILAISKADLVVFHGMMLEGKLSEVLSNGGKKGVLTFDATAALPAEQIIFPDQHDGDEKHPDPHVWFDPKIWSSVAREFTKMISNFDPSGKIFYTQKMSRLINEYYQKIANVVGYQGEFTHDLSRPTGMQKKLINSTKLKEFGWQYQTTIEQGILKTYDFFLNEVEM